MNLCSRSHQAYSSMQQEARNHPGYVHLRDTDATHIFTSMTSLTSHLPDLHVSGSLGEVKFISKAPQMSQSSSQVNTNTA